MNDFPDAVALVVGDGGEFDNVYEDELKEYVLSVGMASNVVFTGFVSNTEIYYKKCDMVVHASIEPEPFGLVITEAMQYKVPIIASKLGAGNELIEHGKTGLICDPRDTDSLLNSMIAFASDKNFASSCANNALHWVTRELNSLDYTRKISGIYREVLHDDC